MVYAGPSLRRRVQIRLNKGEVRNALTRAVFMFRLGEIIDRELENKCYQASCLTLLTAAISLWNTNDDRGKEWVTISLKSG